MEIKNLIKNKKKIKTIIWITLIGFILIVISLYSTIWIAPSLWGSHNLGNNLFLIDGNNQKENVILYCSNYEGNICKGGMLILPTYEAHMKDGEYAEYVEAAKSNKKWVITKTFRIYSKQENYWIINKKFDIENLNCDEINCDSIIQSYIYGPMNQAEFNKRIKEFEIKINFKY